MPFGSMLLAVLVGFVLAYGISKFVTSEPWRSVAIGIVVLAVGFYLLSVSGLVDWLDGLGRHSRRS